jgi:hypothetical protein
MEGYVFERRKNWDTSGNRTVDLRITKGLECELT